MAKGIYTQTMCLLTNGQTSIDDVKTALVCGGFEIVKQMSPAKDWRFSGVAVIIPYLPEVNGFAAVDVVENSWPDSMGDPKTDIATFGAWSTGQFGPLCYPGGLERAIQHSWAWPEGRRVAFDHRGFIRIRLSYTFGASDNDPVFPDNYESVAEMRFLSRVVMALFEAPGIQCYFNPNGEVICDVSRFRRICNESEQRQLIPLVLWMNVRFFKLNEELGFMDTVGNGQLDIRDVEAIFPLTRYEPGEIDYYLRNVTHYLLDPEREIKSGESIDGPGESNPTWTIELLENGTVNPPRQILQLFPTVNRKAIQATLATIANSS